MRRLRNCLVAMAPSTASLLLNPGVNGPTGEHDLRIVESEEVGLRPASVRSLKRRMQFSSKPLSCAALSFGKHARREGSMHNERRRNAIIGRL